MKWIIENWYLIFVVIGAILGVIKFIMLSKEEKLKKIQGWLLQAVILSEKEFGSDTGELKLSAVYDKFCGAFPTYAKALSYDTFSNQVDISLDTMRKLLIEKSAVADVIVNKK